MEIIVFILCLLFFCFDVTLLKKRAGPLFNNAFHVPVWQSLVFLGIIAFSAAAPDGHGLKLLKIIFVILLLGYVLRRRRFFEEVRLTPEFSSVKDETLELGLSTFSIMTLWLLGMIILGAFFDILNLTLHWQMDELTKLLLLTEISSVLLIVFIYRAVTVRRGLKLFSVLGLDTRGLGGVKIWLIPAVFALGYAAISSFILDGRETQPMTPLQGVLNQTNSMGAVIFFVGAAVLTAPFFEEVIFRGFLFHVIKPFMGVVFAVVFVALIFGVLHVEQYWGDWDAILVVGLFGLSLTMLRAWTGSAVPGMIAHYIYNTVLTMIPVVAALLANPLYLNYELNYSRMTSTQKEEVLLQCITRNPKFSNAYNDLAWLYSEEGIKLDKAMELINRALSMDPGQSAYLDTKAEVLFKMGHFSEAIAIENELILKNPEAQYFKAQLKKFQNPAQSKSGVDI